MSDEMIDRMNGDECKCDKAYLKDLGDNGHFGNCKYLLTRTKAELATIHPDNGQE